MNTLKINLGVFVVGLFLISPSYGDHLGPVDLSRMRVVHSDATDSFKFFLDPVSGNYFVEYFELGSSGQLAREIALVEPTNKVSPKTKVDITRMNAGSFSYEYTVENGQDAKQRIIMFKLSFSRDVTLKNSEGPLAWLSLPQKKDDDLNNRVGWVNINLVESFFGLAPGESKRGFRVEADYLPGIINASYSGAGVEKNAEGRALSNWFPHEISENLEGKIDALLNNDTNKFTVRKTVGPMKPIPTDAGFICDTFILDLIGQVREAVTAGWIKHDLRKDRDEDDDDGDESDLSNPDKQLPGVAKSIIRKLTKVRRECMRGKFGNAREKLRTLIRQVNAQRGKHLTEESYALIKFNTEFLLEKL